MPSISAQGLVQNHNRAIGSIYNKKYKHGIAFRIQTAGYIYIKEVIWSSWAAFPSEHLALHASHTPVVTRQVPNTINEIQPTN